MASQPNSFEHTPVWLVTGSSTGLGHSIVSHILRQGERVVATSRSLSSLLALQPSYPAAQLLILPLDVTKPDQVEEVFEQTKNEFGRLDVVVNNAGYGINGEFESTPDEPARRQMEVCFWGPVNVMREAIRFFREVNPPGHGGKIINMSSLFGAAGLPAVSFYAASKFALEGLTESLISELPPEWNIHAIILEPGGFQTNMLSNSVLMPPHPAYGPESPSRKYLAMLRDIPYSGDPEKAARVIWDLVAGFGTKEGADETANANEQGSKRMTEWPIRLPLGSVAWRILVEKAKNTLQQAEEWEDVSHGTNFDGIGRDAEGI